MRLDWPDWRAETSPRNPHAASSPPSPAGADTRGDRVPRALAHDAGWTREGRLVDPTSRPATHRRPPPPPTSDKPANLGSDATAQQHLRRHLVDRRPQMDQRCAASPPRSRSVTNSQESAATTSTDQIVTPPPSDTSAGLDGPALTEGCGGDEGTHEAATRRQDAREIVLDAASQESQIHRLSAVAAVQHRMVPDEAGGGWSRKRMADGAVKTRDGSASPARRHSRNPSAVSVASTTGSNIGQLSSELKTLLSYAMVKVNHGWKSRPLDEVESLASHAVSPTSSAYTVHRAHNASASPQQPGASAPAHPHFSQDPPWTRRWSNSIPSLLSPGTPALADAAPIQPSVPLPRSSFNARRNSNPRHTPTTLSRAPSASPHTPGPAPRLNTRQPSMSRTEQDVAESLLFMSSPGNSANLKQAFSPSISPSAQQPISARNLGGRHALPSGPRKALPSQRPAIACRKAAGKPAPPGSPVDLDSPQSALLSPVHGATRRRTNGAGSHVRASMSLPSGLGMVPRSARKNLQDEDIERMLDRAGAEPLDSSDGEEIQLPPGRKSVARILES